MKEDTCLTMGILSLFEVKTLGNDCPNSLIPKQPAVGKVCFILFLNEIIQVTFFVLFQSNQQWVITTISLLFQNNHLWEMIVSFYY